MGREGKEKGGVEKETGGEVTEKGGEGRQEEIRSGETRGGYVLEKKIGEKMQEKARKENKYKQAMDKPNER